MVFKNKSSLMKYDDMNLDEPRLLNLATWRFRGEGLLNETHGQGELKVNVVIKS